MLAEYQSELLQLAGILNCSSSSEDIDSTVRT